MKSWMILYGLYIFIGVAWALLLLKTKPLSLFFWGIAFTIFLSFPCIMLIVDSKIFNDPTWELFGQSLLVFFSIIGGVIISCAWTELRAKYRKKDQNIS